MQGRDDVSDELAKAELNLLEYLISGKKTEGVLNFVVLVVPENGQVRIFKTPAGFAPFSRKEIS